MTDETAPNAITIAIRLAALEQRRNEVAKSGKGLHYAEDLGPIAANNMAFRAVLEFDPDLAGVFLEKLEAHRTGKASAPRTAPIAACG